MDFPFFDRHGEPVLWDRRRLLGRRSNDGRLSWGHKDIPGFLLMAAMFLLLTAAFFYIWANQTSVAQRDVSPSELDVAISASPGALPSGDALKE